MFSSTTSLLAEGILVQTNPWPMIIIFLVGAIFFLFKVAYPKMVSQTRAASVLNVGVVLLIMWATLNFGWFLRDNEWGVDEVNSGRLEEIHRLQNKTNGN